MRPIHPVAALGLTLLLTWSLGAAAVTGWNTGSDGHPFLNHDQVFECPQESGEGKYLRNYESGGERYMKGECTGGLATGTWSFWHRNGQKGWVAYFDSGRMNGAWKAWHDNGQKQARGNYVDGYEQGGFKYWYKNGQVSKRGSFVDGEQEGCWKGWHANGKRSFSGAFMAGEKVGRWFVWDEQGNRSKEQYGGSTDSGRCWWPLL